MSQDNNENHNKKIGALWIKEKDGNEFMSGLIKIDGKEHNITVFKNDYKVSDKQPDFNIIYFKPKSDTDEKVPF